MGLGRVMKEIPEQFYLKLHDRQILQPESNTSFCQRLAQDAAKVLPVRLVHMLSLHDADSLLHSQLTENISK